MTSCVFIVADSAKMDGQAGASSLLTQKKLQDLVAEVDPKQVLDEDVEELLMQMADDFIESVVSASCQLAKHRKSSTLETKDLQLHLERAWNMYIPGFQSESEASGSQAKSTPAKKSVASEAHKQRVNQIKKSRR